MYSCPMAFLKLPQKLSCTYPRGHVYFPLTRGDSRLLRAVTLGNGHSRAVTIGNARCLVGLAFYHFLMDAAAVQSCHVQSEGVKNNKSKGLQETGLPAIGTKDQVATSDCLPYITVLDRPFS